MAEVLSQQEIDTLLSALSSGEIAAEDIEKENEEQKVRPYDFKRPNKFSKEQISTIEVIYESYSRIISNFISAQVRSNIQMQVASVEQVTYEEFMRSIPNPTLLTIFKMPPFNGSLILEINPQFGFQMIDLLCGGEAGEVSETRELTDIEKSILTETIEGFVSNMKLAWEDVLEVEPTLEALESNPQLHQTMSPNEPVALITFTIEVAGVQSFANLCIPYLSIEKIIDKLYLQSWFENHDLEENIEYRKSIERKLLSSKVDVSVVLGQVKLTIEDFMGLSQGDVLQLDKKAKDKIEMFVEDKKHFLVQPGTYKDKLSVQILDFVEKDVEEND